MRLPLTKLENIALTIIIIPLTLSPLCLILAVCLGGYIVSLSEFVRLLFLQTHWETDLFSVSSGVHGCRCNERLIAKTEGSKRLGYTGLLG